MLSDFSPYADPEFEAWKQRLGTLPPSVVQCREAEPTASDGRWMRWMQADCESLFIHSVEDNVAKIERESVYIAEFAGIPVGFCLARAGRSASDPLFIQQVAVVPLARRHGAGLALLRAVADRYPQRDVVLAVLDDNIAAHRLNACFAKSIGGVLQREPLRRYRRTDLGFAHGEQHRPWIVVRSAE